MKTLDQTDIRTSVTIELDSFLMRFLQDFRSLARTSENSLGIKTQVSITEVYEINIFISKQGEVELSSKFSSRSPMGSPAELNTNCLLVRVLFEMEKILG